MKRERSAGAVIVRRTPGGDLFLLLHYESGHWDYVKGNIEARESELEAVRRECKEETGIDDLRFEPGFREEIRYFYTRQGPSPQRVSKSVVFYLAETRAETVTLSWEHVGFDWLPFDAAVQRLTFDNAKRVLEKARAHRART